MCRMLLNLFQCVCAGLPWWAAPRHLWRTSFGASDEVFRRVVLKAALYVRERPNTCSPRLRRAGFHESIKKLGDLMYLQGESGDGKRKKACMRTAGKYR